MPKIVHQYRDQLEGRSMLVKKLDIIPVESIVRGYITGSAMKEYLEKGTVCDIPFVPNLKESQKLERPVFTPSTKAEIGGHGKLSMI
jgi:phosphoribosylaminoimidazole-succinocarboxamide synthase